MINTRIKKIFLMGASTLFLGALSLGTMPANAEDCTGILPGAGCVLDENTAGALTIDSGVTLTINGNISIDHTIDGDDASGDGAIETLGLGNTTTQNAAIGLGLAIESLTLADDNTWTTSSAIYTDNDGDDIDLGAVNAGETLNFISGGIYNGEIDGNNGDIVNFGSDSLGGAFYTSGAINSVSVVLTSGSLNVNNTLGGGGALGAMTISSGTSLVTNYDITIGGLLDVDGSVYIGSENTLAANTYDDADGQAGDFTFAVGRDEGVTNSGTLRVDAGGPVDLSGDNVYISVDPDSEVLASETISNLVVGVGGATVLPTNTIDSSVLYDFTLVQNANNLDLVIVKNSVESLATTENNRRVGNVILGALAGNTDPIIKKVQSLLGNESSVDGFNERIESLMPTVDGGYIESMAGASNGVEKIVASQMALNSRMPRSSGMSAGDTSAEQVRAIPTFSRPSSGKTLLTSGRKNLENGRRENVKKPQYIDHETGRIWGRAFGQSGEQKSKDGIDGFDIDNTGVVIGFDTGRMHEDLIFGAGVIFSKSEVSSKNANATVTKSNLYGLNVYGGRHFSRDILLSGSATYIHGVNDVDRYNVGGISGNNAYAEFTSEQLALRADLTKEKHLDNGWVIRPGLFANYSFITSDEYSENGVQGVGLVVDYDSMTRVASGINIHAQKPYILDNDMVFTPYVSAEYAYDLINDGIGVNATIQDVGQSFYVEGFDSQKHNVSTNVGLKVDASEHLELSAEYGLSLKEDLAVHTGTVQMAYDF